MLEAAPTRVIGYPGDKAQQQWGASDRVRRIEPRMVCYRDDTIGGNSGGPVWNDRNHGLFSSGAWAYGVHGYGVGGSVCGGAANQFNGGVRIVAAVRDRIIDWIQRP
jgi:glutamyl endopeptidase